MEANGHLLEAIDLHVQRDGHPILRGANLFVDPGSIHVVLGLNGSGKSTLAYTLMGSAGYAPTRGRILFAGQDITAWDMTARARGGLTLAWQEPARFEGLSVARYISLGISRGMGEPEMERVRAALNAVALPPETYMARMVDESLSGGERKRVELAAIYAMQPKLAVLDEPDSGIDALSLDDIAALIHHMAEDGTAVLLITHRDEVVAIADTASLICEGQIVQTGDPVKVCDRYSCCCRPCDRAEKVETEADYERF
jgi:Fe-S cluster assembly ATP-binding protein